MDEKLLETTRLSLFMEVLLVEHDDEGELEPFRSLVERSGLKGLLFEELWNDEG